MSRPSTFWPSLQQLTALWLGWAPICLFLKHQLLETVSCAPAFALHLLQQQQQHHGKCWHVCSCIVFSQPVSSLPSALACKGSQNQHCALAEVTVAEADVQAATVGPTAHKLPMPAHVTSCPADSLRDEAGFRRSYDGHVVLLSRDGDPVEVCLQQTLSARHVSSSSSSHGRLAALCITGQLC